MEDAEIYKESKTYFISLFSLASSTKTQWVYRLLQRLPQKHIGFKRLPSSLPQKHKQIQQSSWLRAEWNFIGMCIAQVSLCDGCSAFRSECECSEAEGEYIDQVSVRFVSMHMCNYCDRTRVSKKRYDFLTAPFVPRAPECNVEWLLAVAPTTLQKKSASPNIVYWGCGGDVNLFLPPRAALQKLYLFWTGG